MKKNILKKIAAVTLLSIGFQAVLPAAVYASGWPTVDALNGTVNTTTATTTSLTTSQQILKTLKDYGLDTIAYTLAQKLGAKMANKLVNKANGGASGDSSQPSFIENFGSYFSDSDMQQIDKFVNDLTISDNPYANSISKSIIKSAQGLSQGKSPLESFNLDKVVGADWKNFSTDATAGGWDGILALSNTVNTNVGAEIIGKKYLIEAKEWAKDIEKVKLSVDGTKPQGKCSLKWEDYKDKTLKIKEGRENYQFASAALQQQNSFVGPPNPNEEQITKAQVKQLQTDNISAAKGLAENYGGCLEEAINNPVALVSQGVSEATSYALKQTQQVQGWGQIIAGIFVSMFGSFVQSGLSSLSGDFNSSKNKNIGGPEQLLTKNGQQVSYTRAPTIIVNLPESFPESINLTETEIDSLKGYLTLLGGDSDDNSIIGQLQKLDSCIPGPDYDYSERLDNYVTMKTSRLTRKQVAGKNEKKQESRADAAADVEYSIAEAKSKLELALVDPRLNIPGAAVMKQEVNRLTGYRQKYQEKKTALLEKQSALNILYKTENGLLVSLGDLSNYIPGLPTNLPFSYQSYQKLTAAEKTSLVAWAKKTKGVPTTIAEWNALTTVDDQGNFVDRDGAFAWARSITGITDAEVAALITGTAQQREQKMRDYVLATPKPADYDQRQRLVVGTAWDVWSFPERYMEDDKAAQWNTVNPSTGTSPTTDFLGKKNIVRSEYNSMAEKISIKRTVDNAKLDLNDLEVSRDRVRNMLADCNLIRRSIENFRPQPGAQNHTALKSALVAMKSSFKIKEIQSSLTGISMLSSTNSPAISGITCDDDGTNCVDASASGGTTADNTYTSMDDIPAACDGLADAEIVNDEVANGVRIIECEAAFNDDGVAQIRAKVEIRDLPATNPTQFTMTLVNGFGMLRICLGRPIGSSQGVCVNSSTRTATSATYPLMILPPLDLNGIENGNNLQLQPPRDIWETLSQDNRGQLFCYFDKVLANYVNYKGAGISANSAKQQILCSQASKWSQAELGDYIGYVFGDGI